MSAERGTDIGKYEGNEMDKAWAEKNKEIQKLLTKEATFDTAIWKLVAFRAEMFEQITQIVNGYPEKAFVEMPFAGVDGYHSKTLAYSIWHIFRIEDIVAHEMFEGDSQVLFGGDFLKRIGSPIITTGNELQGNEIAEFSKQLNINELYLYAKAVKESTDKILKNLSYKKLKQRYGDDVKEKLILSECVSEDKNAFWLIDYWCGSCRTEYNTCSFATCSEDRICPNVKCCKGKGIDGCYACDDLETCEKGFYIPSNDGANAAKAQAMYIRKYGKKEFLKAHDRLHEKYDFQKTQEILGQDYKEGLRILEEV